MNAANPTASTGNGTVSSLWRYPVKSMLGEELTLADFGAGGVRGDRAYAVLDRADGKVATAKNPRKWPGLLAFHARLTTPAGDGTECPAVDIRLPKGDLVSSGQPDCDERLSEALQRPVILAPRTDGQPQGVPPSLSGRWKATSEHYWPDLDVLERRETVTEFDLPPGTYFDCGTVHLLTTATLERLGRCHPSGRFELQRFRPNLVIATAGDGPGFPENAWLGRTLAIGAQVRLTITKATGRCVMTTLPQGALPRDLDILRAVHRENQGNVGVYAVVARGGQVRRGDPVRLEE